MAESEFLLEMHGISKSFPGVKALDNVSFRGRPGTVHALMGENGAGKSTLMKCLFGIYSPDSGTINLDGTTLSIRSAREALDHGISMIHQELHPIPHRSVEENIWLGRLPTRGWGPLGLIDGSQLRADTKNLLADLQMALDPKEWVANLSVSQIQQMEIARAVSRESRIIIMDEPTSSLTEREVEHLFAIIARLKARGNLIIYISHKMDEILRIADEVTIMRDGAVVGTYPASELTTDLIISRMVGRELKQRFPQRQNIPGEMLLTLEGFTSSDPKSFRDVSLSLRRGEILGIGGLVGAQRTELVEALFGLRPVARGTITLAGKEIKIRNPIEAKRHGLALLTEDRRGTGIFPALSVFDNTLIASIGSFVTFGTFVRFKEATEKIAARISGLRVKTPTLQTLIQNLSGGNQQKVILARWLLIEPQILILDEPTRGIDVGAKFEIYSLIADLANQGKSIVMISSEMSELLGMSDRIAVMCEGRLTGVLDAGEASQESIMQLATQFMI